MQLYTEVTPNPATLKFVSDTIFLSNGVADFPDSSSAEGSSPFASKLFLYPFVTGVFIGRNFVTVSKDDNARWEDVIPVVKQEIKTFVSDGGKFVEGEERVESASHEDEVTAKIRQLIEDQVRPAVAMDGGDIAYEGFEDGVVKLKLRGSCSGCPSSMVTLKAGIENLLIRMVPEVRAVEAV
jgi:Fe-S cluster biogenesis protein NfuA